MAVPASTEGSPGEPAGNPYTFSHGSTLSTRALLTPADRTTSNTSTISALLTPNTRSEAEAALSHNSSHQTDSAAPSQHSSGDGSGESDAGTGDQGGVGARPLFPTRTSTNYINALAAAATAAGQNSSPIPERTVGGGDGSSDGRREGPRPSGGDAPGGLPEQRTGRPPSWNEQDLRHLRHQNTLLAARGTEAEGYSSGTEETGAGGQQRR